MSHGTSAVIIGCACDEYVLDNVFDELGVIRVELALVTACTDERDLNLIELSHRYDVERVVVPCGYHGENLPEKYEESDDFSFDLARRKPNKPSQTARVEDDMPLIESGLFNGYTTGTPMLIRFENKNNHCYFNMNVIIKHI